MKRLEWIDPLSGQVCKMPEPQEIVRHGEGLARGFSRDAEGRLNFNPEHYTLVGENPPAPTAEPSPFGKFEGMPEGFYWCLGLKDVRYWTPGQGFSAVNPCDQEGCKVLHSPKHGCLAAVLADMTLTPNRGVYV